MSYNVYLFTTICLEGDRYALFVETSPSDGHGILYGITGNLRTGMVFETSYCPRPDGSSNIWTASPWELLGTVAHKDVPHVGDVCRRIPVPGKQFEHGVKISPNVPLVLAGDWLKHAIQELEDQGIVKVDLSRWLYGRGVYEDRIRSDS